MNAKGLTPILNVSDIQQSFAWFEKLGWKKSWDWGNPASFGCVCAGQVRALPLPGWSRRAGKERVQDKLRPERGPDGDKGVWMSIWVDDVDAVHRHCLEQGLEITWPPTDMPWNVREMHVRHPDGHVFRIGRGIEEA